MSALIVHLNALVPVMSMAPQFHIGCTPNMPPIIELSAQFYFGILTGSLMPQLCGQNKFPYLLSLVLGAYYGKFLWVIKVTNLRVFLALYHALLAHKSYGTRLTGLEPALRIYNPLHSQFCHSHSASDGTRTRIVTIKSRVPDH